MTTYTLERYHRGRLMAEGAKVKAENEAQAIEKARALFREPEYRNDKFKVASSESGGANDER